MSVDELRYFDILMIGIYLSMLMIKKKCNLSKYGGKIKSSKKRNLNGHLMEIVDEWVYLGGGK